MDSAAALALATEPPNPSVLNHPPHGRTERLITAPMGRHILAQAAYQIFWLLLLLYSWPALLGPGAGEARAVSLLFNSFIWCQARDNRAAFSFCRPSACSPLRTLAPPAQPPPPS